MRRAVLVVSILVRLLVQSAQAATITLAWDPNTEPDLGGYLLSYGTASGQYTTTIDVGNVTSFLFAEPNPSVQYHLALRAYDTEGLISPYSNEVVTTPNPPLTITDLSANRMSPQPVGTSIVFAATAGGGTAPYQFKWWIDNAGTSTVGAEWSTSNMFTWTPTSPSSTYVIRVWARNATSAADAPDSSAAILTMTFAITGAAANVAPTVNAGADQTITLPDTAALSATVSDDGQPAPPGVVTLTWARVSGPGTVAFSAPSAASTTAAFSASGTYVLRLTASDSALSTNDDVTVTVNPEPDDGTGTGLKGQYYNDLITGGRFTTLALTRTDTSVNFSWSGAPAPGVQSDHFSVRWTGQVQVPTTGTYTFATTSDNGVRLWVNGQRIINAWNNQSAPVNSSAGITLTAGVRYAIRVDFYERIGAAQIQLRWTPPDQAETVIPTAQLFP
jgi:hypothetical protein